MLCFVRMAWGVLTTRFALVGLSILPQTNVVAAASASAPCSNCETTSQKVARLEAQLASAKADADRCLSLQQLCDKQSVALKQLQERVRGSLPCSQASPVHH